MYRRLMIGLRSLFRRRRVESEMDDELRFHLERETEENVRRGMAPEEARRAALQSFGAVEQVREQCRDMRGLNFIQSVAQDVRYGVRTLARNPGFALLSILTLALGIGANTAIFSVVNGVLLKPLPYASGDQLVVVRQQALRTSADNLPFSVKEIADYRALNTTLDAVEEYHSMSFTLLGGAEPEQVRTGVVSAHFFDTIGVKPLLGRTFLPDEDRAGAEATLVLSYEYWQQHLGGDPDVVGRAFEMNDRVHVVVGVLPPVPQYPDTNDVYMTTASCPFRSAEAFCDNRAARMMRVFGRVKPGATAEQAQADVATVAARVRDENPSFYPESIGYGATATPLKEELTERARPTLLILLATTGLVLLISCANVADLILARMIRREREMAVRAALGAGRARLVRQLVTESAVLTLAGGALGLLLAWSGLGLLSTFAARFTPRANGIGLDASVLLFTCGVSVLTGLIFGLVPALPGRRDLAAALKDGSGASAGNAARQRLRSVLIVSQVAVSIILLVGAGLMVRSLIRLREVDPGFDPDNVLSVRVDLNWSKYTKAEQTRDFYTRLLRTIDEDPAVLSSAVTNIFPLNQSNRFNLGFQIEGRQLSESEARPVADLRVVSPGYFSTIRAPILAGRAFTAQDDEHAPEVAIVNRSFARHWWGATDPVGARVSLDKGKSWLTIVGVVGDVKQYGLDKDASDEIYGPFAQSPNFVSTVLVRTSGDPTLFARNVQAAVRSLDADQPVSKIQTLEQARDESIASPRLTALLLSLFAGLALAITAAGVAGVMALWVGQRTREIGIRMALGASRAAVLKMVLREGLGMVVVGVLLGVAGALALARFMTGLLFGVGPTDPTTYAVVSAVLLGVAALACFVPARRATSIDPMTALRND